MKGKAKSRWKKWGLVLITILSCTLLAIIVGPFLVKEYLAEKYAVTYTSFEFTFPCQISIHGLNVDQQGLKTSLASFDISIEAGSLFSDLVHIESLAVQGLNLSIVGSTYSAPSGGTFSLPKLIGDAVHFSDIHITYVDAADTFKVDLLEATLVDFTSFGSIDVSSLTFEQLVVMATISDKATSGTTSNEHWGLPVMSLGSLKLYNSAFELGYGASKHKISDLNLQLDAVSTDHLLDLEVERLGFIYQDTLDLQIVLDQGVLSDSLDADFHHLDLSLPGLAINIDTAHLQTANGFKLELGIADSFMSFGMLKNVYPDILAAMDGQIEKDSLIKFAGKLLVYKDSLKIDHLKVSFLRGTSTIVNGVTEWASELPAFNFEFGDFVSNRADLFQFLNKESFYEFYTWPEKLRGVVTLSGNTNFYDIRGLLPTTFGILDARSVIQFDAQDNILYSIEVKSDSARIDQFVDYLPIKIPYGDIHLLLGGIYSGIDEIDTFSMYVNSREFEVEGFKQQNLDFSYQYTYQFDSIFGSLDNKSLKAAMKGAYFANDTSTVTFEGKIEHLLPQLLATSFPHGQWETRYAGTYKYIDDYYIITNSTSDMLYRPEGLDLLAIASSELSYASDADSISFALAIGKSNSLRVLMDDITGFDSLSTAVVLNSINEMQIRFSLDIDSLVAKNLFGQPVKIDLPYAYIEKNGSNWDLDILSRQVAYGPYQLDSLVSSIHTVAGRLEGDFYLQQLSNPYLPLNALTAYASLQDSLWAFGVDTKLTDLSKTLKFDMEMDIEPGQFILRFQEESQITIADVVWDLDDNQGINFSPTGVLQGGSIGFSRDTARLFMQTPSFDEIVFGAQSLNLMNFGRTFNINQPLTGVFDCRVIYTPSTGNIGWKSDFRQLSTQGTGLGKIELEGNYLEEKVASSITWQKDTSRLYASINSLRDSIWFSANLKNFELKKLNKLPGLPEDIIYDGVISGEAAGNYGRKLQLDGCLVLTDVLVKMMETGTVISIPDDHIAILNEKVVVNDLNAFDEMGNKLVVNGQALFSPALNYQFLLDTDEFRVFHQTHRKKTFSGVASMAAHLQLKGNNAGTAVTGTIEILPQSSIRYVYDSPISLVDANKTVSFVKFDRLDSSDLKKLQPADLQLDLDLTLVVNTTNVEVLFSEITQEYIKLETEGELFFIQSRGDAPLVTGKIISTKGDGYYAPPAIPPLNLTIENASLEWNGEINDPTIYFRGIQTVKASPSSLAPHFQNNTTPIDFQVPVTIDQKKLDELEFEFDLKSAGGSVSDYLSEQSQETKEQYAVNLLVLGNFGNGSGQSSSVVLGKVATKLNEISRRNFKTVDLSFSVNEFQTEDLRSKSDLNYQVSKAVAGNRLILSVGGELGTSNSYSSGQSNLIDNLSVNYILNFKPQISIKAERKSSYKGIFEGDITETKVGLNVRTSYSGFKSIFKRKEQNEE